MTRNKTAIALILMFALAVSYVAIPFVNAQNWSISIAVTTSTGLVRMEVRLGNTRQQVPFTGVSLGYLTPGGSWQNVTGLTTADGRIDYYLGTLVTNGVWHFQANVPAQAPLPANPATPDGSWYSQDLSVTVAWTNLVLPSFCLVSAQPSPIGKGQSMFVNVFMSVPIVGATMAIGGTTGVHYVGMYVDITRPDGVKETFGPYVSDPTGGFWLSYTPQTVGNYTAQGRYLGQNYRDDLTNVIPLGKYRLTSAPYIVTYEPDDSPIMTFTVQDDPVQGWSQPPLPTEYWSRPITSTNWDWGRLEGSNWWGLNLPSFSNTGGYDATGNVQLYGKAPNSPHIMWTKSTGPGGQPGGSITSDQEGQFTSTSITRNHWNPIIIYGILIGDKYPGVSSSSGLEKDNRWWAIDIRTGEVLWERNRGITNAETLVGGWIQKFHSVQEYGSWAAVLSTGSGSMGYIYDPWTGYHMANVTNVNWGSAMIDSSDATYRNQGGMLRWYVTGGNLTFWNSTRIWSNSITGQRNWTTGVQWSYNMTAKYPAGTPTGVRATGLDVLLAISLPSYFSSFEGYQGTGYFTEAGIDAKTGALLWGPVNKTIPDKHDVDIYGNRDGAFVLVDKDTQDIYCYSLEDGSLMWGPVSLVPYTNPWSYIELDAEVYGDRVIFYDFGGNVVGLDKESGEIMWHFTRGSAGYTTPWGIYTIWDFGSDSYGDGKAFFSEGHMYDVPLNPARRLAINVTDGSLVWSILSFSGRAPGAIADGYLLEFNSMSYELVCFGKGPTATSVTAGPKVSVDGDSVVVEGMVTDVSPGTAAYNREARFPNGVPAVSEESQREWMEYVYMQQAKPADATGVEVVISVSDPNGNTYDVGTATSNGDGFYTLNFVPEVPGEYVVTARFSGSESYWGSFAQTSLFVEEAPAPSATPTPPPTTMTDTYVTGFGIGIIIAIVVVGLLLFMLIRKR